MRRYFKVPDSVMLLDMTRYSASTSELGPDAAAITWNNALRDGQALLSTPHEIDSVRSWMSESGGWSGEEIAAMSHTQLRAVAMQIVASRLRDCQKHNPEEYERLMELGKVGLLGPRVFLLD